MNLSTKIAYNTIIQVISKFLATALGLLSIALITRYLGKDGFGQYTTVITFISFFGIIADLGLTLITVQMISKPGADQEKILGNLFALRLVTAVLFLGIAPLTVVFFPYDRVVKMGVALVSFAFLFNALNQILVGLFQKNLRMDKVSIAEVVNRIILLAGFFITVRFDYGLDGILLAIVLANLVGFILHFAFSRSFVRIKLKFDFAYWLQIIKKSWPLAITIFLNLIYLKADTLLLSLIKRPTDIGIIAEVGLYGAAYKVIDVVVTFPFMFAGIVLPILTATWAAKNQNKFKLTLQKSFDVMIVIAIPMIVGTQLLSEKIMTLIAGKDFIDSAPILNILIIAAALIYFGSMFSHAVIAINKQKKIISAYAFTAVSSLILYLVLIPKFSYFAAAWITIYSEFAIALASLVLIYKATKFLPNLSVALKSVLASLAMAGSIKMLYYLNITNLFIIFIMSIIIYFGFLYLFKGLTKKDILILLRK